MIRSFLLAALLLLPASAQAAEGRDVLEGVLQGLTGRDKQEVSRWDSNGDGVVTRQEFASASRGQGQGGGIETLDRDGDGDVELSEFRASGRSTEQFDPLDDNGDGRLTRGELQGMSDRRFSALDENGDGILSGTELGR